MAEKLCQLKKKGGGSGGVAFEGKTGGNTPLRDSNWDIEFNNINSCELTIYKIERSVLDNPGRKTSHFKVLINDVEVFTNSGLNNSGTTNINQTISVPNNSNLTLRIVASDTNQYEYIYYAIS